MKNGEPTFSIIVPVYKVEDYLDKCVQSLVSQTYSNIEIILVDDGSPDLCPQKCDEWAAKDLRITAIHKTNGGLSDARNYGIRTATGKYVMFVDSDDYIEPTTCSELKFFSEMNVDIIAIDADSNKKTRSLIHLKENDFTIRTGVDFIKRMAVSGSLPMAAWLYVYRRDFLINQKLAFKKGVLHEDEQFTPRAILTANSVVNSGLLAYHYIIRDNSITTGSDKRKNVIDFLNTCEDLEPIYNAIEDDFVREYLLDSLVSKYLSLFVSGKMYRFGGEYINKKLVNQYSFSKRNRMKALLFTISPYFYCVVNSLSKRI